MTAVILNQAHLTTTSSVANEVVDRARGDLPELAALEDREKLLIATWLISLRSPRTRRSYGKDLLDWSDWLNSRDLGIQAARRPHVDLWVSEQLAHGAQHSSVCRRLSSLSSFYKYLAAHDLVDGIPTAGIQRPSVDPDHTTTVGLDRDQAKALLAAADADYGRANLRTKAIVRLLLHNAIRTDELIQTNIADLGHDRGHRVLEITRKGSRRARLPLAPNTWNAIENYLTDRAEKAGLNHWTQLKGPLVATTNDRRLRQNHLWKLIRRLAREAQLDMWHKLSAHSLRHTAITLALDAGATLRDVQDFAGHRDPRTTRRYDHSRHSLDRSPAYTLANFLS